MDSRISRWLVALAFAIAAPSCGKSTKMTGDTPTGSATGAVPKLALGAGLAPAAFAPGRYATAIQRTMHGTHELQVLNEDSTSAFALELAADGSATACRGWRYVFHNDGPETHNEDRYREQQGYRGRYTVADGVAEVVLSADNAVCPHVFEGGLALARAPSLKLRCVLATPGRGSALPAPVLLCQPLDGKPSELDPLVVEQLAAGWFALGSGPGLQVWVTGRPPGAQEGDDVKATAKVPSSPLPANVWDQAF